ncbi:penicillin-binding protein activator [Fibrobacter sp.]|uniref:penicillin-binding protein activator n=1 Tax=Fibrobacter sp. TaxID=35828 RepID=UPI0026290949|nr:penicillin-binding protein activator [Fibrobacter sp.]MDD7499070.1 penicillin-binding protein activator [Fibrobacter sp.]MDY5724121.1 penicillin-binding protein activator [Fibrobacter sp.]
MKRLLLFVLAAGLATTLFAQDEIAQAKSLIQNGRCAEAVAPLQKLYKSSFRKPAGEKAAVMLAECYMRDHKRDEALKLSSRFLEYYVNSAYRERMELANAIVMAERGNVYEGVESMLRILAYTKNPAAKSRTKDVAIQTIAASLLTADQLQALLEKYPVDKDVIGWLQLQIGRECQNSRRYRAARYWYKKVLAGGVAENLSNTAQRGLESLEGQGAGMPTVLVLAPLSGDFAEFGAAAIQGVILAHEKAGLQGKVNLRVADTRADAAQALLRTQQAVNQDSIVAVIGPIMSAPAATVAAWLGSNFQNIPMLTPTATDDGIAKMGPNIFQVNITMDNLAKSIADFATKCLSIREFAVLSPLGGYGASMSQSFTQAVERRGGSVVAFRNYEEGRPDYKTEFSLLRDVRFKQLNRRQNIARGAADLDAVNAKERRFYMQDSTFNIPGIFIPATNPGDAGLMAGQVAFNKISGVLLGASGWYGRELLIQGKRQVDSSYFSVPAMDMDGNNENLKKFVGDFKERWGDEPGEDKVSGLSYDAANIVFSSLAKKPNSLTNAINNTANFPSVYGEIKFKRGVNTNAKIVTVNKGKFETVEGCPAK